VAEFLHAGVSVPFILFCDRLFVRFLGQHHQGWDMELRGQIATGWGEPWCAPSGTR
jgi:hypothetical protein